MSELKTTAERFKEAGEALRLSAKEAGQGIVAFSKALKKAAKDANAKR